jgi:hypothetical protein
MAANAVVSEPVRISRATHVLASRQGDVTILASIKTGQFHTLDEIGNLVWDAIGNGGRVCDIVDRLAEQVPLKRESVRDRLIPFLQELYSRQLIDLDRWESPARVHPDAIPLDEVATDDVAFPVGLSVAMLCLVSVALRFLNLETVWRLAHRQIRGQRRILPANGAPTVLRQVTLAATWSPLRAKCLEQSLVILWALRRRGVDARLKLGVQQYPFCAHAWVEYQGRPLNDRPENLKLFRAFPEPDSFAC